MVISRIPPRSRWGAFCAFVAAGLLFAVAGLADNLLVAGLAGVGGVFWIGFAITEWREEGSCPR